MKEAIVLLKHPELGLEEEIVEGYFEGHKGKSYFSVVTVMRGVSNKAIQRLSNVTLRRFSV